MAARKTFLSVLASLLAAFSLTACATVLALKPLQYPRQAVRQVFEGLDRGQMVLKPVPFQARLRRTTRVAPEIKPPFPSDPPKALLEELSYMMEVPEALQARRQRQQIILQALKEGTVGEGRDGLLAFLRDRRQLDRELQTHVANENDDRLIFMRAMAKAVLALNGLDGSERAISSQLPSIRGDFAHVRRRLAPQDAWIQLPDGQWLQK